MRRAALALLAAGTLGCASVRLVPVQILEATPREAALLMREPGILVVDVSPSDDYDGAHIFNAISIPRSQLWSRLGELGGNFDAPILVYDTRGERSGSAAQMILDDGYNRVYELQGGLRVWTREGYPVVPTWEPQARRSP